MNTTGYIFWFRIFTPIMFIAEYFIIGKTAAPAITTAVLAGLFSTLFLYGWHKAREKWFAG